MDAPDTKPLRVADVGAPTSPRGATLPIIVSHESLGIACERPERGPAGAVWRQWQPLTPMKRATDLALGSLLLVMSAPLQALAAVAIRGTMGAPVLFRQRRAGQNGRPFTLLKFRTMSAPAAGREGPAWDHERLTAVGRLLRDSSVDELPSLWNVLRGDMSLVGPRPLLVSYIDWYTEEQARRLLVKPGLTGWAQIHGRNALTWEERFSLDCWYVDHRTWALDLQILVRTVIVVIRREGISFAGVSTMTEFRGSDPA